MHSQVSKLKSSSLVFLFRRRTTCFVRWRRAKLPRPNHPKPPAWWALMRKRSQRAWLWKHGISLGVVRTEFLIQLESRTALLQLHEISPVPGVVCDASLLHGFLEQDTMMSHLVSSLYTRETSIDWPRKCKTAWPLSARVWILSG